jgi:SAM-dependent methyltransferase
MGGKLSSHLREFRNLVIGSLTASRNMENEVDHLFKSCAHADRTYERLTGKPLEGVKALEIGPGQMLAQMLYFGAKNEVVGIDLDVIANGLNPIPYLKVLKTNGPKRFAKTIARKVLGQDRAFRKEFARRIGRKPRLPRVRQMDATRMDYPDNHFDVVYSFSVFEHLPNPKAVLKDMSRVLKPGGVAYTNLHLFTSDSGCHDIRIIINNRANIAFWPHLRPAHEHEYQAFAYLNKIRLEPWREIFTSVMPGSEFDSERDENLRPELEKIRAGGELADYSDDELLTRNFIAAWRKPGV